MKLTSKDKLLVYEIFEKNKRGEGDSIEDPILTLLGEDKIKSEFKLAEII